MQSNKEEIALEISNLPKKARIENDSHSLEVTSIKDHSTGPLFYVKIIDGKNKKCLFNGPVLLRLRASKRITRK